MNFADLEVGEGHVEGGEEEVGEAEDQDEDILRCQHHLGMITMIVLFKQKIMHDHIFGAKLLGTPLHSCYREEDSPPTTKQLFGSGTSFFL